MKKLLVHLISKYIQLRYKEHLRLINQMGRSGKDKQEVLRLLYQLQHLVGGKSRAIVKFRILKFDIKIQHRYGDICATTKLHDECWGDSPGYRHYFYCDRDYDVFCQDLIKELVVYSLFDDDTINYELF